MAEEASSASLDFVRQIVTNDKESGKWQGRTCTRFPPEPNGYLHIGHAKSICLNFGLAKEFGGKCNLRFDDTNPTKEEQEYVDSIKADISWLGWEWGESELYASNYFEQLYEWAVVLIRKGLAYVDDQSAAEIREKRGTLKEPGLESPCRERSVEENLDLFARMKSGEFPDGSRVLRAKIDMASPNLNMRDPVMYRILHANHHRTGTTWSIYPMYDWAHGQSDALEGVTHSICTLEFQDHRPLYDWFINELELDHHPQQIEFARLNVTHTITSKRKLLALVKEGFVRGWDDPRMPTVSALRRRGFTPLSVRNFCERIGVARRDNMVEFQLLEHCLREDLNKSAQRRMAVMNPLKVIITNFPEGTVEELSAINNPEDESAGSRVVPFTKELYIERDDFMEDPPKKFFRLAPGREVRLRYAFFITCNEAIKNDAGEVIALHCTYDPETRGGNARDGRKVKATMHWVSAEKALDAEVRLYEHLFAVEDPAAISEDEDWRDSLNPDSLVVNNNCKLEPSLGEASPGDRFQFERIGYFACDPDSTPGKPVFNRAVTLKDSWSKIAKKS